MSSRRSVRFGGARQNDSEMSSAMGRGPPKFPSREPRRGSRPPGPHGDAVPLAGRLVVGRQPRRRDRRSPPGRCWSPRRPPTRSWSRSPGCCSACRGSCSGSTPGSSPTASTAGAGDRGRPAARRRARRPHRGPGHRRGERPRRPRGHVPARHRRGLRRHDQPHAAADGRGQARPRHRQRPADDRRHHDEPAGRPGRGRGALRGRHGVAVRRPGGLPGASGRC